MNLSALARLLPLTILACVPAPVGISAPDPGPADCPYIAPAGSDPFHANQTADVVRLVGRYDLYQVTASDGPPLWTFRSELTLTTTDSLFRPIPIPDTSNVYAPWLAGTLTWLQQDSAHTKRRDSVQVEYDTMYVGCRHCSDGVVVDYHIIAITPYGFWGLWIDRQTGLGSIVDSTGRWLPNPAGHFCARRK